MSVSTLSVNAVTVDRLGDPSGAAQTRTRTQVYAGKASVQPMSGDEVAKYQRDTEVVDTMIYFPGSPSLLPGDIVTETATGYEYVLRSVRDAAGRGNHTECEAERQR